MRRYARMKRPLVFTTIIAIALGSFSGAAQQPPQPQPQTQLVRPAQGPFVPVTDEMLWKPDPANWLMWRRTLDSWGYSPLNQINRNNVGRLKMVWTRGMGPGNIQEATPLVYNGVMYLPNPSDFIQALDAKSGDVLWEYRRRLPEDLGKFMPAFVINRNLAIFGNAIIDTSADDFVYALEAQTGKMLWETQILDYKKGAQQ